MDIHAFNILLHLHSNYEEFFVIMPFYRWGISGLENKCLIQVDIAIKWQNCELSSLLTPSIWDKDIGAFEEKIGTKNRKRNVRKDKFHLLNFNKDFLELCWQKCFPLYLAFKN